MESEKVPTRKKTGWQSRRFYWESESLILTAGQVEVYAVTREGRDFRQSYLLTLAAGEAVFPAMDEFEEIDILIPN